MMPHEHRGGFVELYIGRRSFRRVARRKLQLSSRLVGLDRFIPMSGYDVAGVRMLGRRWACSGVVVNVVSYVRSVSMLVQCFLIRSRMLLGESLVWRCWGRSWGGICPGRLFVRWREVVVSSQAF